MCALNLHYMRKYFLIIAALFLYVVDHAQIISHPYDPVALARQEKNIRESGYRECIQIRTVHFQDGRSLLDTSEHYYFGPSGRLEKRVAHSGIDTTYYYYDDAGKMSGDYRKGFEAPYIGNYYIYDASDRLRSVCNFFEQSMFTIDSVNAAGQVLSLTRHFITAAGPVATWMGIHFEYDRQGKLARKHERDVDMFTYDRMFAYDASGNLIKSQGTSDFYDSKSDDSIYTYEPGGLLQKIHRNTGQNEEILEWIYRK